MVSPLVFPISTQTLQDALPHRAPMIWVTSVLAAHESGGECVAEFDQVGIQCQTFGLRQSSLLEMMAQSIGYTHAAFLSHHPTQTYLAALQEIEFTPESNWRAYLSQLQPQKNRLLIQVSRMRVLGPITLVKAEVRDPVYGLLASGQLKIFAA